MYNLKVSIQCSIDNVQKFKHGQSDVILVMFTKSNTVRPTPHNQLLCGFPAQLAQHTTLCTNVRGSNPTVLLQVLNYSPIGFWTGMLFRYKKNPRNDTSEKININVNIYSC